MSGNKSLKYFYVETFVLKILGINLIGDETKAYKVYSILLLVITIGIEIFLGLREIVVNGISSYIDYMVYQFAYFMVSAKIIATYVNRDKLRKILENLHQEPFSPNVDRGGQKEQTFIDQCCWITKCQMGVYWGMAFTTVLSTIILTVIIRIFNSDHRKWILPYGPLTLLNTDQSPEYEITMLYQTFSMACCTTLFTGIDLLIASVLAHISYQFRLLQNSVKTLIETKISTKEREVNNSEFTLSTTWECLHILQIKFVKYHLAVINVARQMEEAFSQLLLIVYLGTIGLLCFEIYRGSVMTNYLQLARTSGEIISFLVQIGVLSFWGEQVIFQSQEVCNASYQVGIVGTDLRFQKGLLLTMIRSQRPVKLTAGKFAFIQLFTFTWVVKTSYSAFMILRHAQN